MRIIYTAIGTHPHDARLYDDQELNKKSRRLINSLKR